jgi:hypothetical protein
MNSTLEWHAAIYIRMPEFGPTFHLGMGELKDGRQINDLLADAELLLGWLTRQSSAGSRRKAELTLATKPLAMRVIDGAPAWAG